MCKICGGSFAYCSGYSRWAVPRLVFCKSENSELCNEAGGQVYVWNIEFSDPVKCMNYWKYHFAGMAARPNRKAELFMYSKTFLTNSSVSQPAHAPILISEEAEAWDRMKMQIQVAICAFRMRSEPKIMDLVMDSHPGPISFFSPDNYWGMHVTAEGNIEGENALGIAWAKARDDHILAMERLYMWSQKLLSSNSADEETKKEVTTYVKFYLCGYVSPGEKARDYVNFKERLFSKGILYE